MKYIIFIIAVITLAGCNMNRSNSIHLSFNKGEDLKSNKELQVNLILYNQSSASKWYAYQKRITVIYKGKLIARNITEKNIVYSEIEISNPIQSLYYKQGSDNIYANIGVDVFETYKFHSTYYDISLKTDADLKKIDSYSTEYLNVKEQPSLNYYEPTTSRYRVYPLDNETIKYIMNSYTFEELVSSEKLLKADILRLKHLTPDQTQKLISIHENKDFRKLGL